MKRMLNKTEELSSSAFGTDDINRLAVLEMMGSETDGVEEEWEYLAGEEFDESGFYSPDEVGLGNWFASGYDD